LSNLQLWNTEGTLKNNQLRGENWCKQVALSGNIAVAVVHYFLWLTKGMMVVLDRKYWEWATAT
jgi:hypothetical protein